MHTRLVRLSILLVVLLAFLSVLVGCNGSEAETVKIVASICLLPEKRGIGWDTAQGMILAIEEAEYRAGGLDVEFELRDSSPPENDVLDPELEEAHARETAADPNALVYLGNLYSSGCKISVPILNQAGVLQISPGATYPGLTKPGFGSGEPGIYYPMGKRNFFRVVTTDDMQGPAGALWAQDQGLARVYILRQDDLYGRGLAAAFRQAAWDMGLTVVGTSTFVDGQTTGLERMASYVASSQPDLVYYTGFQSGAVLWVQALRAAGVDAPFMGADGIYTMAIIDELGDQAEGIMATFPGVPVAELGAEGRDFSQRFREAFGREPGGWSIQGYDAMGIALEAIERAGAPDRALVRQAMRDIEFEGLAGRYTFDENGDTQLLLISGVYVENGEWRAHGLLRVR